MIITAIITSGIVFGAIGFVAGLLAWDGDRIGFLTVVLNPKKHGMSIAASALAQRSDRRSGNGEHRGRHDMPPYRLF